ncbi:MAG: hypothetical protein M3Z09_04165 [Acidobacteriota bacterium]|nr:hypothetical protein [Acidobacteriota bacterium]
MTLPASHSQWREEYTRSAAHLTAVVESEIALNRAEGGRSTAETLNQIIRRLRKAESESEAVDLLIAESGAFAGRVVAIIFEEQQATLGPVRGVQPPASGLRFGISPALLTVIETKDPVVTAATETELSRALFDATDAGSLEDGRAHLFPLMVGGSVRIVIFAADGVNAAPMEVLSEAAAMRLEALAPKAPAPAARTEPLVNIAGLTGLKTAAPKWSDLPPAEQAVHLRAQRFARVAVARMRVEHAGAVKEGQARANLYEALRPEIERARQEYRDQFQGNSLMPDYLYLELLRSLANDEDQLLGPGFPGRLA